MAKKYLVAIEIEMGDDSDEGEAAMWATSMLECAFRQPNPVPCPKDLIERIGWTKEIALPPSKHPYRPRIVRARAV